MKATTSFKIFSGIALFLIGVMIVIAIALPFVCYSSGNSLECFGNTERLRTSFSREQ